MLSKPETLTDMRLPVGWQLNELARVNDLKTVLQKEASRR